MDALSASFESVFIPPRHLAKHFNVKSSFPYALLKLAQTHVMWDRMLIFDICTKQEQQLDVVILLVGPSWGRHVATECRRGSGSGSNS